MVDKLGAKSLHKLPLKAYLPVPHLVKWLRVFKEKNKDSLAKLRALAAANLAWMRDACTEDVLGRKGRHFLETPTSEWFATAGEMHIFENPGDLQEPRHFDGGTGILHIGVTIYGRRDVRFHEGPETGDGPLVLSMPCAPGHVYMGTVTGVAHLVAHKPPRVRREALGEHSVTCMLRTTLFPGPGSHYMKCLPLPQSMYNNLVASFVESLQKEPWALPTLDEGMSSDDIN